MVGGSRGQRSRVAQRPNAPATAAGRSAHRFQTLNQVLFFGSSPSLNLEPLLPHIAGLVYYIVASSEFCFSAAPSDSTMSARAALEACIHELEDSIGEPIATKVCVMTRWNIYLQPAFSRACAVIGRGAPSFVVASLVRRSLPDKTPKT